MKIWIWIAARYSIKTMNMASKGKAWGGPHLGHYKLILIPVCSCACWQTHTCFIVLWADFFITCQVLAQGLASRDPWHCWFYSHVTSGDMVSLDSPHVHMCKNLKKEEDKKENKGKYKGGIALSSFTFWNIVPPEQWHSVPFYFEDAFSVLSSPWAPCRKSQVKWHRAREQEWLCQAPGPASPRITCSWPRLWGHRDPPERNPEKLFPCPVDRMWYSFPFPVMDHVSSVAHGPSTTFEAIVITFQFLMGIFCLL